MASTVTETLEKFNKTRQLLREMYDESMSHFAKLQAILQDDTLRDTTQNELPDADSDMFLSRKDKTLLEKVLTTDPVIILSGKTNCGKTSLINEFLGGSYFPTKAIPCTARIVQIFYSEKNYMQISSPDGKEEGDRIYFDKKKVPADKINLGSESRAKNEQVQLIVKVGLKHPLLEHGIQLVDVPGLNENEELDEVVKQYLDGMLQLLVYVIDGRDMVKTQDVKFVTQLKTMSNNITIIYVCNKVEEDKLARESDRFSDSEQEEEIAVSTAERTFQKLKKRLMIPATEMYSPDLPRYHGLSCKEIRKARLAKPEPIQNQFTKNFERFQNCLFNSFSQCVTTQLTNAVQALFSCQRRLYDIFISDKLARLPGNRLADYIQSVRKNEQEFQTRLNWSIDTKWKNMIFGVLEKKLQTQEEEIMESVKDLEFQPIILSDQASANHVVEMCRMQVRDFVLVAFIESVEKELRPFEEWLEIEAELIRKDTQKSVSESDSRVDNVLQKHLATRWTKTSNLKFDVDTLKDAWIAALRESVKSKLNKLKEDVEFRMKGIHLNDKWKQKTAASVLRSISLDSLTGYIVDAMKEKIRADYGDLEFAMNSIMSLWNIKERQAQNQRNCVKKMIPEYTKNLCITDALNCTLQHGPVPEGELISRGSKTNVYVCAEYKGLTNLVMKRQVEPIEKPLEGFRSVYALTNIVADQSHEIVIPSGVAFDKSWKFCVLMPRFDRTLFDLLRTGCRGLDLASRVGICYSVTRGCRNAVQRELRLNDIRANNIFFNQSEGHLSTIYNLTKWQDLHSHYPDGLPPFHFAPEVLAPTIFPKHQRQNHKTYDTFSLTVLLLELVIGHLVRPKFAQSTAAYQQLTSITDATQFIKSMHDDFLQILEDNFTDKKDLVYKFMKHLIDSYIGIPPGARKPLDHFLQEVKELRNLVGAQCEDGCSTSSSSSERLEILKEYDIMTTSDIMTSSDMTTSGMSQYSSNPELASDSDTSLPGGFTIIRTI